MVNTSKLYKQLTNGKLVQIFYNKSSLLHYTVWLTFKNETFNLHSFHFEGNDVFDESNYQDEQIEKFHDFRMFCNRLVDKFPGIEYR
jgi:hypothetical protein